MVPAVGFWLTSLLKLDTCSDVVDTFQKIPSERNVTQLFAVSKPSTITFSVAITALSILLNMKLSVALLVASAASVSGFGVAPAFTTSRAAARTSVILEASRNAQKIASRSAWATARGAASGGTASADAVEAGLMTNDGGLEYVKLVHPNGSSSEIYLFGGDVTSYKDADGVEYIAVRPDAKMDGSKPISGGLSHCWPQVRPFLQIFLCDMVTVPCLQTGIETQVLVLLLLTPRLPSL